MLYALLIDALKLDHPYPGVGAPGARTIDLVPENGKRRALICHKVTSNPANLWWQVWFFTALCARILCTYILQPLHPNIGDLQRDPAGPAGHVNRGPPRKATRPVEVLPVHASFVIVRRVNLLIDTGAATIGRHRHESVSLPHPQPVTQDRKSTRLNS